MQALRFFVGEPVWTPHNRPNDHLPARYELINSIVLNSHSIRGFSFNPHNMISMCRQQYVKDFVEKDVGNHAVDAAA